MAAVSENKQLTDLPLEVHFEIVKSLTLKDAARLAQTCHAANEIVESVAKDVILRIQNESSLNEECEIQKFQDIDNPSFLKTLFNIHEFMKNTHRVIYFSLKDGQKNMTQDKTTSTKVLLNFEAFQEAYQNHQQRKHLCNFPPQQLLATLGQPVFGMPGRVQRIPLPAHQEMPEQEEQELQETPEQAEPDLPEQQEHKKRKRCSIM